MAPSSMALFIYSADLSIDNLPYPQHNIDEYI